MIRIWKLAFNILDVQFQIISRSKGATLLLNTKTTSGSTLDNGGKVEFF